MGNPWTEQLEELGLAAESAGAPPEHKGEWLQALAEFRKLGFARLLVSPDPARIALHAGHPEIEQDFSARLEDALTQRTGTDWTVEETEGTWWLISDSIGESERTPALATILRLAESLRDDEPDWEWLTQESEGESDENGTAEDSDDPDEAADEKSHESEGDEDSAEEPVEDESEQGRESSPFETIGDESIDDESESQPAEGSSSDPPDAPEGFSFNLVVQGENVAASVIFDSKISDLRYELEEALTRNLRAKFDVKVEVLDLSEARELGAPYPRSVALRLIPTSLTKEDAPSVADVEHGVGEYLETIESLAGGGIDPLVFLGVKDSSHQRRSSPRDEDHKSETPRENSAHESEDTDDDEVFFLISDEDESESDTDDSGGGVVLATADIDDDAPLETGRFDDPRLDEPDASTSLVDVVLRHPGYSDRRVGQVLSILFSIEYYEALRLMNAAPLVIARGVSSERGHTIQNVVDGAGGRVKLTEPDRFPVSE